VRTTHDANGTSIFASDETVTPFHPFGPENTGFSIFDTRPSVPVSNTDPVSVPVNAIPRCAPGGTLFAVSDFPPHYSAPMHRTVTIDYAVVLSGEIVLLLDGGEEKTLRVGDMLVQQGVNHEWCNRGDVPCRVLFVLVSAKKVVLADGRALEETVIVKR
jgi:quercetin dioxygenase-like cupin family protein